MEPVPESRQVLNQLIRDGDVALVAEVQRMGRRAREIVPQCVGLSVALLDDGLTFTLVASSHDVASLDAVQYLDGGPCVDAAHDDEAVDVATTAPDTEQRWQMYARASAAAGIASSLKLPILGQDQVIGTVNLYASTPAAFEGHHDELAGALGSSAELAITNADLSFSTRQAAAQAPERLADLDDIDIAIGTIAESQHVDIETARQRLRMAAARADITEGQAARAVRGIHPPSPEQ